MSKEQTVMGASGNDIRDTKLVQEQMLKALVGRLKEVVEATTADKEQREAIKNILTDKIYEWYNHHLGWSFSFNELREVTNKRYKEEYPESKLPLK